MKTDRPAFTLEDVERVRELAATVRYAQTFGDLLVALEALDHDALDSIAERIAAHVAADQPTGGQ